MNILELKKMINNVELIGDKIFVPSNLSQTLVFIKNNFGYNLLKEIIAVDLQENGIELIYKLHSLEDEEDVLISTIVKDKAESISTIFDSAVADEKEIYDMFGIIFVGNPELKRLYMPDSWQGHPLKKDYEENDERLNWND